eukprot:463824-Pyramimonas_sp.AAC.1
MYQVSPASRDCDGAVLPLLRAERIAGELPVLPLRHLLQQHHDLFPHALPDLLEEGRPSRSSFAPQIRSQSPQFCELLEFRLHSAPLLPHQQDKAFLAPPQGL